MWPPDSRDGTLLRPQTLARRWPTMILCEFLMNCGNEEAPVGQAYMTHAPRRREVIWLARILDVAAVAAGDARGTRTDAYMVEQMCYPVVDVGTLPEEHRGPDPTEPCKCVVFVNPLEDDGRVRRGA